MSEKQPKRHHFYSIVSKIDGRGYIGQTTNTSSRWSRHKSAAKNPAKSKKKPQAIAWALHNHGIENFTFEVIATIPTICTCKPFRPNQERILEPCKIATNLLEDILVIQYDFYAKNGNGYNVAPAGQSGPARDGSSQKGKHNSPTTEFKPKIDWPENQKLIDLIELHGLTPASQILGVNPSSLFEHMQKRNLKYQLPSMPHGSKHHNTHLNENQVLEIVRLYATNQYTQTEIGDMFNATSDVIGNIISGKSWYKTTGIPQLKVKHIKKIPGTPDKRMKLTEEDIRIIMELSQTLDHGQIGKQFSVSRECISAIMRGKRWSKITGIIYLPIKKPKKTLP